jgi:hypothetical protein
MGSSLKDMKTIACSIFFSLALVLDYSEAQEPLFEGPGSYTRTVTTTSPEAQRYSSGPHINLPLVPVPAAERAWKELGLAKRYASHASHVERGLIEALSHRYANPQPEDRGSLDRAYADVMRRVWQEHPNDPDVGAFFAEAMMDLRLWDQWTLQGQPQPGTEKIIATIDVLKLNINHPLANHLYTPLRLLLILNARTTRPTACALCSRALPTLTSGVGAGTKPSRRS